MDKINIQMLVNTAIASSAAETESTEYLDVLVTEDDPDGIPLVVKSEEGTYVDYLAIRNVSVVLICIVAVLYVFGKLGFFNMAKPSTKIKQEQQDYNAVIKKRKFTQNVLSALEGFAQKVGGGINDRDRFNWDFRIQRLMQPIEAVGRTMTPIEVVGLLRFVQFFLISVGIAGLVINGAVFFAILVLIGIVIPSVVTMICDMMITEQDKNIERDFTDFYLLVHSHLLKGTNAHIANTLTEYIQMCDATMEPEDHKDIRGFAAHLRATISVMSDEQKAINQIRDRYKSATVVNFCNLASAAMQGVDNQEGLLTFKLELIERQKTYVRNVARERAEKATKSIYAIWLILAEFVVIVMVTRLMVVL